jgi:queuine tRNA-ribosyltransferase
LFEVLANDPRTAARRGRLTLAHGVVDTPVFMPVGTQATVKSAHPAELRDLGASIILSNTYHLVLRPGLDVIRHFGSLHRFMRWDRPLLTDSGGFQIFSLRGLREVDDTGVTFQSHLDGARLSLTPESAMESQAVFGSDIAMVLDECPPAGCGREFAEVSLDRTRRWAERCRDWIDRHRPSCDNGRPQHHFGIVQGSVHRDLRERAARDLAALDFPGYAVGGVSVGESEPEMLDVVEAATAVLPHARPRYTMGVGTPPQLLEMIARGVDMFDCVLPTRVARNGAAFTTEGLINLRNKRFEFDEAEIDPSAPSCSACAGFPRGYIRHLIKADEILGLRLLTLHNLHFYLSLMRQAREHIEAGTFASFKSEFIARYQSSKSPPTTP